MFTQVILGCPFLSNTLHSSRCVMVSRTLRRFEFDISPPKINYQHSPTASPSRTGSCNLQAVLTGREPCSETPAVPQGRFAPHRPLSMKHGLSIRNRDVWMSMHDTGKVVIFYAVHDSEPSAEISANAQYLVARCLGPRLSIIESGWASIWSHRKKASDEDVVIWMAALQSRRYAVLLV